MFGDGMLRNGQGVIIPETSDGRLIFVLSWNGSTMVGTTDELCEPTFYCEPSQKEIDFIIEELKPYFGNEYDYKRNLKSAWAGLRPLVKSDPKDLFVDRNKKINMKE